MFSYGEKTYIMGILNVTPDSFSDGGDYVDVKKAISHALEMVEEGADIIDIGGESTRPGSSEVGEEEELKRVIPVVRELSKQTDIPISVDTYKEKVAKEALENGAKIINDVWGFQREPEIAKVVAEHGAYAVLMHNKNDTEYEGDMVAEIKEFFKRSIKIAKEAGVLDEKIILDPGIGFGKTPEQNIHLMSRIHELRDLGYPILLGTSRKSMIGKILDLPPKERVEGTVATTVMGIIQGVDFVRVHDIKENLRAAKVTDAIYRKRG